MSTKTIRVVGQGSEWQKVGIELGSYVFHHHSSQPGMFQTFAARVNTHQISLKLGDVYSDQNFTLNFQIIRILQRILYYCQ